MSESPRTPNPAAAGGEAPVRPRTEQVRRVYRLFAPFYDAFRAAWSRVTPSAERALDRIFGERIDPGARVLELGPGTGVNIERLLRTAPGFGRYLGVDASEDMLGHAREKARGDPRVELRIGDITALGDLGGSFDFVVCTWVLSHLERPEDMVRDAVSRLAPGGTAAFLFSSPPRNPLLRAILAPFYRAAAARFVDPDRLRDNSALERIERTAGGLAALAVFHAPEEGSA